MYVVMIIRTIQNYCTHAITHQINSIMINV